MLTTKNILPVTTVKKNLMKLLNQVESFGNPIVITRDGKAAGILMGADEFEGWLETLEILKDKETMESLKKSIKQHKQGKVFLDDEVFNK